eukprot:snap_masked-scaffold_7-processed-gene-8.34-mRNA-1 protein AED:1.00 eAED:1.00 QI:0/0/0/0/1/1/2/0/401
MKRNASSPKPKYPGSSMKGYLTAKGKYSQDGSITTLFFIAFTFLFLMLLFIPFSFSRMSRNVSQPRALNSIYKEQRSTKPKIVLVPELGLANRLRTMKSFQVFKECSDLSHYQIETYINWPVTFDLSAGYTDIFESPFINPISNDEIFNSKSVILTHTNSESITEQLLTETFNRSILEINEILENNKMQEINIRRLLKKYKYHDYIVLASAWGTRSVRDRLVHCSVRKEQKLEQDFLQSITFHPVLQNEARLFDSIVKEAHSSGGRVISVHVRLTDSVRGVWADRMSTAEETLEAVKKVSKRRDKIFLATDDPSVISIFKKEFGKKLIQTKRLGNLERNSLEGIRQGLIDLIRLSKGDIIIGNHGYSSFTRLAGDLAGKPISDLVCLYRKDFASLVGRNYT